MKTSIYIYIIFKHGNEVKTTHIKYAVNVLPNKNQNEVQVIMKVIYKCLAMKPYK